LHTSDFDYDLPAGYIAQTPLEQRDQSRLLILDRHTGDIRHAIFRDIGNYLRQGDMLVLNETRVIPARLFARKVPSGGKVEILLLRKRDEQTWEALVGGKGLTVGKQLKVSALVPEDKTPTGEIIEDLSGSERLIQFDQELEPFFPIIGHVPLPPYIHTTLQDPERYQTVYANNPGSAAAPTAGLHFTPELITQLIGEGIQFANVTLHVGLDTFAPVNEGNPREHRMHTEWCQLMPETAEALTRRVKKEAGSLL
jgi:S-adenosylmethionine:tRNA ribosyltransferase-isomerase